MVLRDNHRLDIFHFIAISRFCEMNFVFTDYFFYDLAAYFKIMYRLRAVHRGPGMRIIA